MESKEHRYFRNCCMPQCRGFRYDVVHRFPRKDERRLAWITALRQPLLQTIPQHKLFSCVTVCARHFRPEDYKHSESKSLNPLATPSLNIKDLSELHLCKQALKESWKITSLSSKVAVKLADAQNNNANTNDSKIVGNTISVTKSVSLESKEDFENSCDDILADTPEENCLEESVEIYTDVNDSISSLFNISLHEGSLQMQRNDDAMDNLELDIMWLRYNCQCEECFDGEKYKRKSSIIDLDLSRIEVREAEITSQYLYITWNDDHRSHYAVSDLYAGLIKATEYIPSMLWCSEYIEEHSDEFMPIAYSQICYEDDFMKTALERLRRVGVLIIVDSPEWSLSEGQKSVTIDLLMRRLLPNISQRLIKETRTDFFTSHAPIPHTNCTFESYDCGLQILSLSQNSRPTDCVLTLVDGFNAATELKELDPKSFDFLKDFKHTLIFQNASGSSLKTDNAIIELKQGSHVNRINFLPYHTDVIQQKKFRSYVESTQKFITLLQRPDQHCNLKMKRNMLIIIDNGRICWQMRNDDKCEANIMQLDICESVALDCYYVPRKYYESSLNNVPLTFD